jgi:surface antigen
MDFRFWSPPFFNSKEEKQHKSAVYMALNHVKDFEVVSWYSKSRGAGGKVRPIFTYAINSSTCRDIQVLLYIEKKARSKTFTACKFSWGYWSFNYWDWPGAEKYLN